MKSTEREQEAPMSTTKIKERLGEKLQAKLSASVQSAQQSKHTEGRIITMPDTTTALAVTSAPIESNYVALTNNALDIINENLKNQPLSHALFDVVKPPSGGTVAFTVPGLSGDEIEKELTGIILDYSTPRAYWQTPDPIEGTPPVCYSRDSIISFDGKPCSHCAYNDFGSKKW